MAQFIDSFIAAVKADWHDLELARDKNLIKDIFCIIQEASSGLGIHRIKRFCGCIASLKRREINISVRCPLDYAEQRINLRAIRSVNIAKHQD